MEVIAHRLRALSVRGLFYAGLFFLVIIGQAALTALLRHQGFSGGAALGLAGAGVFAAVIAALLAYNAAAGLYWRRKDTEREALGLPVGPVCAIWRWRPPADLPWVALKPFHARFPKIAKSFGIEGFAVVAFEIGADGKARNLHLVDCWPAAIFYDAAAEALRTAEFRPRQGFTPRFGETYQLGFVFRILGAAKVRDPGARARRARPQFDRLKRRLTRS